MKEVDNVCVFGGVGGRGVGVRVREWMGGKIHLQRRVRQCVITVPKSFTRCQWNAAQGFVLHQHSVQFSIFALQNHSMHI